LAEHDLKYSKFIFALNGSNIQLNRKILSNLAVNEPFSFKAITDEVAIQGKMTKNQDNKISLLQAYAKNLIIDGPLKKIEQDEPLPYLYTRTADFKPIPIIEYELQHKAQILKDNKENEIEEKMLKEKIAYFLSETFHKDIEAK